MVSSIKLQVLNLNFKIIEFETDNPGPCITNLVLLKQQSPKEIYKFSEILIKVTVAYCDLKKISTNSYEIS